MRDYPKLNHAELTVTANTALGLFLRLKLGPNAMHPIEEAIGHTNKDNGFMILQFLLNHYGRATDEDISRAKQLWENTTWVNRDTIDTHSQRFLKRLSLLRDSVATRPDRSNDIPTNDQASMKYLSLLVTSLPKSHGPAFQSTSNVLQEQRRHGSIREVRHQRRNNVIQTLRRTTHRRGTYRQQQYPRPPAYKSHAPTIPTTRRTPTVPSHPSNPIRCSHPKEEKIPKRH
jgi:hypothetical protein